MVRRGPDLPRDNITLILPFEGDLDPRVVYSRFSIELKQDVVGMNSHLLDPALDDFAIRRLALCCAPHATGALNRVPQSVPHDVALDGHDVR